MLAPPCLVFGGMSHEPPAKPRRKIVEVPVHGDGTPRKTFGANFAPKRHRHRPDEAPDGGAKASRRQLSRENERLARQNDEVLEKFNELEELSVKRITKLKEKIASLQKINEEVTNENAVFERRSQELLEHCEELRTQLESSKNCANCEDLQASLEKFSSDNNLLRINKKEMEEDLGMLKNVVYRLNLQVERYQDKLRIYNIKSPHFTLPNKSMDNISTIDDNNVLSEIHHDHTHTPISWGRVNVHTLGPLLDAYQDTIAEKDEIIQDYQTQLSAFTGKLKDVVRENETLHQRLTEDEGCSSKLREEVERVRDELKTCKDQNDALIKKCALKQDKIEEILRCYEAKVDQLKRDYGVVHEQYYKGRSELAALKEKNKALTDAQDDFKNERQNYIPISVHNASVNECKKWYEELKLQYEQEKDKLKETIAVQGKLVDELKEKITSMSKLTDDSENKVKHLEKQIKKGESKHLDLEHVLNQVQLSRSACRKQLHKAMSFAKDLVAEQETLLKVLNQRQEENKTVRKYGCDIASKMDSLKNQLKDVQRDAWQELSSVEKRIEEQTQTIATLKNEHIEEISRLKEIIREQEASNLLMKEQHSLPMPHYLLFRGKHSTSGDL